MIALWGDKRKFFSILDFAQLLETPNTELLIKCQHVEARKIQFRLFDSAANQICLPPCLEIRWHGDTQRNRRESDRRN